MRDGLIAEHWAHRDDLGTGEQLGWSAPTPALPRCAARWPSAARGARPTRRGAREERPFGPWPGEPDEAKALALRAVELMRGAPPRRPSSASTARDARTRPLVLGPPLAAGTGPRVFPAAARRLPDAFAELDRVVHHVVAEDDLVAVHATLTGRHVAPLAFYDAQRGARHRLPAHRASASRRSETHWVRLAGDGRVAEHWVNRDDLGMAMQLGWIPPTPPYLVRMALAKRRFRP